MAANIQKRDIQTGLKVAWHGLTNVVDKIERKNSGICYAMERQPLFYTLNGEKVASGFDSIVSMDDGLPISRPIGESYKLITNEEIWEAVENAMGGTAHRIVSCGTVNNREKGFISIELDKSFSVAGNENQSMLNIMWGHGGTLAVIARTGVITIVCQNTLNAALREKKGEFSLSVRHTKNAEFSIENMGEAIENHFGVVAEFKKAMEQFANETVNVDTAKRVYAGFVGSNEDKLSTRSQNTVERLVELFQTGAGNRGQNKVDLLSGLTDFYSHESSGGENRWKQFVSSEFGTAGNRKTEFLQLLADNEELSKVESHGKALLASVN